ncbi:MAG: hypothetical protein M3O70_18310 [Actinomycetota bacterium]|nr:hypothetical protein [Actinomycetota bacterium]
MTEQDTVVEISLDDLTSDELLDVEDATGKTVAELFPGGTPSYRGVLALYWAARRRQEPSFSWDDARKMKVNVILEQIQQSANGQPSNEQ